METLQNDFVFEFKFFKNDLFGYISPVDEKAIVQYK
jgi:hypothetical protein